MDTDSLGEVLLEKFGPSRPEPHLCEDPSRTTDEAFIRDRSDVDHRRWLLLIKDQKRNEWFAAVLRHRSPRKWNGWTSKGFELVVSPDPEFAFMEASLAVGRKETECGAKTHELKRFSRCKECETIYAELLLALFG